MENKEFIYMYVHKYITDYKNRKTLCHLLGTNAI